MHRRGHLILVEAPELVTKAHRQIETLREHGISAAWLDASQVADLAPALKSSSGAIHVHDTAHVGDPLTLTLKLSGPFTRQNVYPPVLGEQPALTRDFRIYDDTVRREKSEDSLSYLYTVRPTRAGTREFPPIEVSFYDVNARAYRTVRTRPVPVRARESAQVMDTIVLSTATGRVNEAAADTLRDAFIPAPLDMDPEGARPGSLIGGPVPAALAAIGPAACGLGRRR